MHADALYKRALDLAANAETSSGIGCGKQHVRSGIEMSVTGDSQHPELAVASYMNICYLQLPVDAAI